MSAFTIALVIWLTLLVIYRLSSVGVFFSFALAHGGLGSWILYDVLWMAANIFFVLAIVGIITHYYPRGETASLLRWGPICGIAGPAADIAASVLFDYQTVAHATTASVMLVMLSAYVEMLIVGIPSYIEYLKEGAPVAAERVAQAARSGQLSTALARRIDDIDVSIDQMRKRIQRDLTLLTVALPIIFLGTIIIVEVVAGGSSLQNLLVAAIYVLFGGFLLIVAVAFSSLLKKPRFTLLGVNNTTAGLEAIAAAERHTLVKDARQRLAIFLLVYAFPVFFWAYFVASVHSFSSGLAELTVSLAVLLLSALVCVLLGYWVLTRSTVGAIALDEPALHGLFDASVGVLPTKVRAGEAHSVLMDFNMTVPSGGATSSTGGAPAFDTDLPRHYYGVELQAAGANVDGEKRCAILHVPAACGGIWSCSFPSAGTQALHLLLKEVHDQGGALHERPLFAYMHDVRVDGRFTASADNMVSILSIIITAVSVLTSLGAAHYLVV
jgi:hypothetical protein